MIKKEKGITLISLIITIAVMIIISSITVSISLNRFEINKFNKMKNDIELLSDKVANYYIQYKGLPVLRNSENNLLEYPATSLNFDKNSNDNDSYYIIDLEEMHGISLNYGKDGYEAIKESKTVDTLEDKDVYIINEESYQIYYVKGIEMDGIIYYTIQLDKNIIEDTIPPSKPQIKVVSGTKNDEGIYITEVELEIVPGKDSLSQIEKTTYSINSGTETDITTLTNNIFEITEEGSYNIIANSYDAAGNISGNSTINIQIVIPKIGDKVAYNELSNGTKTYSIDYTENGGTSESDSQTLSTEDLEWRILDIEDDGTIELISTNPTTSTLYLNGEKGYLNAKILLNNTCKELYGKGEKAIRARALDAEDVEKLAGITTDAQRKAIEPGYGTRWLYRFSDASQYVQYSSDNGTTWADTGTYTKFKIPGKKEINSENPGQEEVESSYYYMRLDNRINTIATDGLSVSDLIINGEDNESYVVQWLASTCVLGDTIVARFQARTLDRNMLYYYRLVYSNGSSQSNSLSFRPVVSIKASSILDRDSNGVLQLNVVG